MQKNQKNYAKVCLQKVFSIGEISNKHLAGIFKFTTSRRRRQVSVSSVRPVKASF